MLARLFGGSPNFGFIGGTPGEGEVVMGSVAAGDDIYMSTINSCFPPYFITNKFLEFSFLASFNPLSSRIVVHKPNHILVNDR